MLKKVLIGTAAAAMVAAPMAASAEPWGHERFEHHHGGDAGAAVAAGIFGLAVGAALASNHYDYDHRYGYGDYGYGDYGYYRPVRCHWETRAYPGPWGGVSYQNVRVCYRY
jgi:hypothetical protein